MRAALSTAVFEQPPIVARICAHLETLHNVMRLARCSKLTYARVLQCVPEVALIHYVLPTGGWQVAIAKLMERGAALNTMMWHTCCRYAESEGHGDWFVGRCFEHEMWELLNDFLYLTTLRGDMVVKCITWRNHFIKMPKALAYWHATALYAIRFNNSEWLQQATYMLFQACRGFSAIYPFVLYCSHGPYSKRDMQILHDEYIEWYREDGIQEIRDTHLVLLGTPL